MHTNIFHYIHVSSTRLFLSCSHSCTPFSSQHRQQYECLICWKGSLPERKIWHRQPNHKPPTSQLETEPHLMAGLRFNWFTPGRKKATQLSLSVPLETNQPEWEYWIHLWLSHLLHASVRHDKTRPRDQTYSERLNLAYLKLTDWFLPCGTTWVTWQNKMWLLALPTWMKRHTHSTLSLFIIMSVFHIVSAVGLSRMCCSLSPSPGHLGFYSKPRHRSCCPSEVLVFV